MVRVRFSFGPPETGAEIKITAIAMVTQTRFIAYRYPVQRNMAMCHGIVKRAVLL